MIKKVCLRRVWIRLTTAYLLCAREFRQNNALALQFWCLSNALTLWVRVLDASKYQRACIILSKFTRKRKYAVINLQLTTEYLLLRVHCDKIIVSAFVPKNNARALLSRILSIVNSDWLQHERSVRGVYEYFLTPIQIFFSFDFVLLLFLFLLCITFHTYIFPKNINT